ncbi:hypothetical protein BV20DRAFT_1029028 [Pilatotrama ljubarskyi]|nr:hypothetical protein BV20DRAFT_1029028 [Pilatotrama ljubarskyi]
MDSPGSAERSNMSGIVLHVKEYAGHPPEVLSFRKSASRTISVGRKPSQGGIQDDPERALFRCPVVSRKHAKITFTEYGNVYIIDLHSHHGTYILRPGELVATALKPEVPTVLADGDLITFGKSVGRESYLVRPVVVRVQLIFGKDVSPRAPSPLPISLTNDSSPDKASARSTSGRYGVYPPSPESSPSTSDGDSDIQEISPPSPSSNRLPSFDRLFSRSDSASVQSGRLRLLQSILPPIHIMSESPPPEVDESFFDDVQVVPPPIVEAEDMDLSSSRSASPAENHDAEVTFAKLPEEPPIVGAWPGSPFDASESSEDTPVRTPEPRESAGEIHPYPEVIEISDDEYGTHHPPVIDGLTDAIVEEAIEVENVSAGADMPEFVVMQDGFLRQVESIAEASARVHELAQPEVIEPDRSERVEAAAAQTAEILNELHAIRSTHEDDEAAFSAHVQQTKERLNRLDDQMVDTHARLSVRDDQLQSIQTRLQGLGALVTGLQERNTDAERDAARVEELMHEVSAAKDLLRETCDLQRVVRTQMEEELNAIKALRAEAAAVVAEAKLAAPAPVSQLPISWARLADERMEVPKMLKRKRDDLNEDGDNAAVPERTHPRPLAPLPSKRRRTMHVVSQVVQTATVAGMGAVAAWAALAFS